MTGSHNLKAGFQWGFGSYVNEFDINGDLVQRYRNGAPDIVRIYNTPQRSEEFLNGDFGLYIQDQWTKDRLTINAGLRTEIFRGQISNQDIGPGRFVPAPSLGQDRVHAVLDRLRAALRRRLRSVRERQDGVEGVVQQVHGWPDARLRAAL